MAKFDDAYTRPKPLPAGQKLSSDHFLISQERVQKLELLSHLLVNLTQSLVICGPEGVGKTTFLNALQTQKKPGWSYLYLAGSADLSFESIQEVLGREESGKTRSTTSMPKMIVVLLDNAGALVPGLMSSLIRFASGNPRLRMVFTLTHDELHLKSRTDQIIDECHFVDIPPLSEKQCGDFLQHLSAQPFSQLAMGTIDDALVARIYRDSHGIPGRIIAQIPNFQLVNPRSSGEKRLLIIAVASLIVLALALQWFSSAKYAKHETPKDNQAAAKIQQSPAELPLGDASIIAMPAEALTAKPAFPDGLPLSSLPVADPEALVADLAGPEQQGLPENAEENGNAQLQTGQPQKPPVEATQPLHSVSNQVAPEDETGGIRKLDWLMAQENRQYTLQLMVLTQEASAQEILKKYAALADGLGYVKRERRGLEKFIIFYGLFDNTAQANQAKQLLPQEFNKAVSRNIGSLKKEVAASSRIVPANPTVEASQNHDNIKK